MARRVGCPVPCTASKGEDPDIKWNIKDLAVETTGGCFGKIQGGVGRKQKQSSDRLWNPIEYGGTRHL